MPLGCHQLLDGTSSKPILTCLLLTMENFSFHQSKGRICLWVPFFDSVFRTFFYGSNRQGSRRKRLLKYGVWQIIRKISHFRPATKWLHPVIILSTLFYMS